MNVAAILRIPLCGTLLFAATEWLPSNAAAGPVRDRAAVAVTFDEANQDGQLPVAVGPGAFTGTPVNGASLEASPFWQQSGKKALRLDASRKQFVQLEGVPLLDRPDAVSLSFFYLNLHSLDDAAAHGIVAKRADGPRGTNYGINFSLKGDALQIYINDGRGFRIATYSARNVLGYRRLVHLTATFEVADAPAPDEDTDRDDVLIRLYLNGQPVQAAKVTDGAIAGNDAWLLNVDVDGLLNDAPLTLGSSTAAIEHSSGLLDEFLLYTSALSPSDAAALFLEVAGPNGAALAKQELQAAPVEPEIADLSLYGLQSGKTTRLVVGGRGLSPNPRVQIPLEGLVQQVVEGSNAGRLIVDLMPPADAKPGFYPLRIQTDHGLSAALPLAVDELPQLAASSATPEQPASLPAAFSGSIAGAQVSQVYFRGRAGERLVAAVESRRLGAGFDPVLEVKTEQGTPLAIEWAKIFLKGDARAEVTLPADGLYYAELHDLSYKAPGSNPFRLVLGDVALTDAWFPPSIPRGGSTDVEAVGSGFPAGAAVTADVPSDDALRARLVAPPATGKAVSTAPPVRVSDATEVLEAPPADGSPQKVDARFAGSADAPVVINGRISRAGEADRYLLDVTPGQTLTLRIDARSIDSPLDARLAVSVNGGVQISRDESPGSRDPQFNYKVPAGVNQVEVSVADLYGRGGPHFLYRLPIVPAGRPNFSLRVATTRLNLPADGTAVARLDLTRAGYNGAVKLRVVGVDGVGIAPDTIPAGGGNRKFFVTLHAAQNDSSADLRQLRLVGESVDLPVPIQRYAVVAADAGKAVVPGFEDALPVAVNKPNGLSISVKQLPGSLLKSLSGRIEVEVQRGSNTPDLPVRLSLVSTEAARPVNPQNPAQGNMPLVESLPDQYVPAGAASGQFSVSVPQNVAEGSLVFVIRAELLSHAYSSRVLATAYSDPFELPVEEAVNVAVNQPTLNIVGETANKVTATIRRADTFKSPAVVAINGLPQGYSAPKVTIPADAGSFEIVVTAPRENEKRPLPRVTLTITDEAGLQLLPPINLAVTVSPKPQ